MNVDMDDVIHEHCHNVPVYTNMSIKWGWIFLVKGEEVTNNGKTSKIVGFYEAQKLIKILQWSPLWIIFKGKIKIAHLLPVIGPKEMPILFWGRRKRPQIKMGLT